MTLTYFTEIIRTVKKTPGRFISIISIVALGVSFFAGIRATGPEMRAVADKYYNELNYMDIHIVSTMGISKREINSIKEAESVKQVTKAYSVDVLCVNSDNSSTVKLLSYDFDDSGNLSDLNRPRLVEGAYPIKNTEVLADRKLYNGDFEIGDTVTFVIPSNYKGKNPLKHKEFIISGIAESPLYISTLRGSTGVGNGILDGFFYLPAEAFNLSVATDIFVKLNKTDNQPDISRFSEEFQNITSEAKAELEEIAEKSEKERFRSIKRKAIKKLKKSENKIKSKRKKLHSGEKKLKSAYKKIKNAENEYNRGHDKFFAGINAAEQKLIANKENLTSGKKKLNAGYKKYHSGVKKLKKADKVLTRNEQKYAGAAVELSQLSDTISQLEAVLELTPPGAEYDSLYNQITELSSVYTEKSAELLEFRRQMDTAQHDLKSSKKKLSSAKKELDKTRSRLNKASHRLQEGYKTLKKEKNKGLRDLSISARKIINGKQEYTLNKLKFQDKSQKAEKKLKSAEKKINRGYEDVNGITKPEWYIFDSGDNSSFADYSENCTRLEAIGRIFPMIFFLVAVLVSLTSMTRMVEYERLQIGILKALGYGKFAISLKYIIYSFSAGVTGILLGTFIGFSTFPRIISNAYSQLYRLPPVETVYHRDIAAAAGLFAIAATVLPAIAVCFAELKHSPAELTIAKAPKPGKKIFLERITPLSNILSFNYKITLRNLFRYKKRFFMTITGVAGCTALLFTGFGLYHAVSSIADVQFNEITPYDITCTVKSEKTSGVKKAESVVRENEYITDTLSIKSSAVDISSATETNTAILTVLPASVNHDKFIKIRGRLTGLPLPLTEDGAIITEKLAMLLQVGPGDRVHLEEDGVLADIIIADICENYLFHYIYLSDTLYKKIFSPDYKPNVILANIADDNNNNNNAVINTVSEDLLNSGKFSKTDNNTKMLENFNKMINALYIVIAVLVISAASLAFLVLISLTSINIDERRRELATLKVLGFKAREMITYVFREGILLSITGAILGLVLGDILCRYVIKTSEIDNVMFFREKSPVTYLISFIITIVFAVTVSLLMNKRLAAINPAESLKSE